MRQVLLRLPFSQPWDFGPLGVWPGFGFGVLLLAWTGYLLWWRFQRPKGASWNADDSSRLVFFSIVALGILIAPRIGPIFAPDGLPIYGYGMMVFLGIAGAVLLARRRVSMLGLDPELIWDLAPWLVLPGIAGGRIAFLVTHAGQVLAGKQGAAALFALVNLAEGGLVLNGALIGGAVGLITYCRRNQLPVLALCDVLIPSVFVGIGFGRIGCLLNGCCFGRYCDLPWGVSFPPQSFPFNVLLSRGEILETAAGTIPLHPTQLYSSLDGFLIAALCWWYYPHRTRQGSVICLGLLVYSVTRFLIELLRADEPGIWGTWLTVAQWQCVFVFPICLTVELVTMYRRPTKNVPPTGLDGWKLPVPLSA